MSDRSPVVRVEVDVSEAELTSLALFEHGASGIEEQDETTLEPTAPGRVALIGHFADEAEAAEAAEALGGTLGYLEGEDWRHAWKAFFKPTRVGARLVVRPSWEPFEPGPRDVVLTIDPGQAFGTGTHETTRLVLAALEGLVRGGERVLDVGCGSGILAIAALRLGAEQAEGVDIDPVAARAAEDNAAANGVRLATSTTPIEGVTGRFELVLANIRGPVLIPMRDALTARLREGAALVLSGLLATEEAEVRAAFDAALLLVEARREGDWVALVYRHGEAGDGAGSGAGASVGAR